MKTNKRAIKACNTSTEKNESTGSSSANAHTNFEENAMKYKIDLFIES